MNLRELSDKNLLAFTKKLSTREWRKLTALDYAMIYKFIGSDGCTGVPDFYKDGCTIHDFWYRTHRNLDATPITQAQADLGLKRYIQSKSLFGRFSPIAQWRYFGVRALGGRAWE